MTEHTPGPWWIEEATHMNGVPTLRVCHGTRGEIVCTMETIEDNGPADACLIASAPDILAALEVAYPHIADPTGRIRKTVREAIDKAKTG